MMGAILVWIVEVTGYEARAMLQSSTDNSDAGTDGDADNDGGGSVRMERAWSMRRWCVERSWVRSRMRAHSELTVARIP